MQRQTKKNKRARKKSQISRQLRRQRRLRELHRCIICNKSAARKRIGTSRRPTYASRCAGCLAVQRARYHRLKTARNRRGASPAAYRGRSSGRPSSRVRRLPGQAPRKPS